MNFGCSTISFIVVKSIKSDFCFGITVLFLIRSFDSMIEEELLYLFIDEFVYYYPVSCKYIWKSYFQYYQN